MKEKLTVDSKNITISEFRYWVLGLMQGKQDGSVPDADDWELILVMLDNLTLPISPSPHYIHPVEFFPPKTPWSPGEVTC